MITTQYLRDWPSHFNWQLPALLASQQTDWCKRLWHYWINWNISNMFVCFSIYLFVCPDPIRSSQNGCGQQEVLTDVVDNLKRKCILNPFHMVSFLQSCRSVCLGGIQCECYTRLHWSVTGHMGPVDLFKYEHLGSPWAGPSSKLHFGNLLTVYPIHLSESSCLPFD